MMKGNQVVATRPESLISQERDTSLQLLPESNPAVLTPMQKLGAAMISVGLFLATLFAFGAEKVHDPRLGSTGLALLVIGSLIYILAGFAADPHPGVKNHFIQFSKLAARGVWGWLLGIYMVAFYVALYFYPQSIRNLIELVDPLKVALSGASALSADGQVSQWFLYGLLYTLAVVLMGFRAMVKYRHSRYQLIRTASVMFFQLGFAFLIPNILLKLNQPYYEWTNIWPLRYYELFPSEATSLFQSGAMGKFMLFWGVVSIAILTPLLTYFFGKRWYCSWVCGCGGLAETLGDPFRQNANTSLAAWRLERRLIYAVLVFVVLTTAMLWGNHLWGGRILGEYSGKFAKAYGFLIGSIFSGVIGTGFYPIFGNRVWCRFGCPMAAILGILQRNFSRFRITTNGGQCISCGNCSAYCEMGIDVRWYAQRGQNIVRASCVGCGICSAVCPRGVLNLENGPMKTRFEV